MNHIKLFESFDNDFLSSIDTVWDVVSNSENEYTIDYKITNLVTGEFFKYNEIDRQKYKVPKYVRFVITLTPDKKILAKDFIHEINSISSMCLNMSENLKFISSSITFDCQDWNFRSLPIKIDPKYSESRSQIGNIILQFIHNK